MNDSFKCIILISCEDNSKDNNNNKINSNIIYDKNANMNYLPENNEFYIFTYIHPSKILLTSKKPILGKEIIKNLQRSELNNNYIFKNNFSFYEFDNVYYTLFPYENIFSENFPFQELINSNIIFIFSSQNDYEKTSSFNSFINIFLNTYDCYSENNYTLKIISEIIFNKNIFLLDSKFSNSPKETLENLREIRKKKINFFQESNLINDNINFIVRFQINEKEICFVKLATKNLLLDDISFASLASDLISFTNSKSNNYDMDNFNIDKYDKINIISCVNSTKENYSQSIKEIIFMNDIYKEINSIKGLENNNNLNNNNNININSNNNMNNNKINNNNNIINNIIQKQRKDSRNTLNKNNLNINNSSLTERTQKKNIKILDNTIILPEMTSDLSESKSNSSNLNNNKIIKKDNKNLNELNSVFSYLENINISLSNDRAKYETRISILEEELKTLSKDNFSLLNNYNLIKEKFNNLEENNNSLNKKILLNEKSNNIKKNKICENNINLINQLKEKDDVIKNLREENEKLKIKCKFYEDKYIDIKSNNAVLNEKIKYIEKMLKSLYSDN